METSGSSGKFFVGSLVIVFLLFLLTQAILASSLNAARKAVKPIDMNTPSNTLAETSTGDDPSVNITFKAMSPGEQVVKQVCSRCHRSGLMHSPKIGNAKDWTPRINKGVKTLYSHAINGFNKMPARGGRASLSDEKITAAVDYMLSQVAPLDLNKQRPNNHGS